jgi:magnesium transporter
LNPPHLPDLNTPVKAVARTDFVRLLEHETVSEALARLRGEHIGERVVYFYVTGSDGKLEGVVPTRRLLLSDPCAQVGSIMVHPVVTVCESQPFGDALQTLTDRKLLALPMVDDDGVLKGVLDLSTFTETMLDLERRESAEEVFQLAGIHIEHERGRTRWRAVAHRFPWLLSNIASGLLAAYISNQFDYLLRTVVALAFFVPLLLTIAESVAMQSLTLSLATLQAASGAVRREGLFREITVGFLLGALSAAIVGSIGVVWLKLYTVAAVVAAGIAAAGLAGAVLGFAIPRLVRHWRLNPTVASGPVTLAFADLAALTSYFVIAASFLT